MDNTFEYQKLIKRGKINVMSIVIYRCLIVLVRIPFFLSSFPFLATANNLHIIFNALIAVGLFLKIRVAGYILAVVLVFWELEWLWTTVRGFSVFTDATWEEGAELIVPFSMDYLRMLTIGRGVFFISIAIFVAYAMFFSKSVEQYFMTSKRKNG